MSTTDHLKFSLPLWPGLQPEEIRSHVIPTLIECRSVIKDLYVTSRTPPFSADAMGGVLLEGEDQVALDNAFYVSDKTGIPLSLTYNNITVAPTAENYRIFVNNFRPLYERGVRIVTIPNTLWLLFGLKTEFPELYVKNTVLNEVQTATAVYKLFGAGFDYINLDRNVLRNRTLLSEVLEVKNRLMRKLDRPLEVSILYNEMCAPSCSIQKDHYMYNFHRTVDDPAFFENNSNACVSPCGQQRDTTADYILKSAGVPTYYSYLSYLTKYIDVFKLHGRESAQQFWTSLQTVMDFNSKSINSADPYRRILDSVSPEIKALYLSKIEDCKFNCWKCNVCSSIAESYERYTKATTNVVSPESKFNVVIERTS